MAEFTLKDWYDKEQIFDKETIYVRGTDGELMPFTHGTGGSADVRYVTFMSEDGTREYGKKAVAVGDDCADPIARGVFATPTKASDAQYNYTFYGWATSLGGAADSTALKSVTENRTVYARFASAYVYYTVSYYDEDGTTLLKTSKFTYGADASYVPEKDGYKFLGWSADITYITSDMNVTAAWEIDDGYIHDSWEVVVARAQAGTAADYYEVGDKIVLPLTYADGTTENVDLYLAAFNDGVMEDGNPCNVAFFCAEALEKLCAFNTTALKGTFAKTSDEWNEKIGLQVHLNEDIFPAMPTILQESIKTRKQGYFNSSFSPFSKLWPAWSGDMNGLTAAYVIDLTGVFPDAESRTLSTTDGTGPVEWYIMPPTLSSNYWWAQCVTTTGGYDDSINENPPNGERGVVFGFCI